MGEGKKGTGMEKGTGEGKKECGGEEVLGNKRGNGEGREECGEGIGEGRQIGRRRTR